MYLFIFRAALAACGLLVTGIAMAQPAFQTPYHSILGDNLTMNVWQGQYISYLTPTSWTGLDYATMASLVAKTDLAYDYYHLATGAYPAPQPSSYYINDRDTVAAVDVTGGAGFSWIGATGVELQTYSFNTLYNGVKQNSQYDQVVFYELGRNFWLYGNQLDGNSSGPNIGQYSFTTGFAVYMRFKSMKYAGVNGAPYGNWTFPQFEQKVVNLVDQYTDNTSLNFNNTLAVGQGVPGSGLGGTDLFASFLFRLERDYGGVTFSSNFWKQVAKRPTVTTDQGAIDNFFLASCYTTQQDLSNLFTSQWRWSLSSTALAEAASIPVIGNAWKGTGSSLWSNSGNWTSGQPANGDTITFAVSATNKINSNNLLSRVGKVYFKEGGFNISGNSLQLGAGITNTGDNTWAVNSTLTGPQSFTSLSGLLTVSGSVNVNNKALTINGNGNTAVNGSLSGSGTITLVPPAGSKDGNYNYIKLMGDTSSFNGEIIVNGGANTGAFRLGGAVIDAASKITMNGGWFFAYQDNSGTYHVTNDAGWNSWGGGSHWSGGTATIDAGKTLTIDTGNGNYMELNGSFQGGGNIYVNHNPGWSPISFGGAAANTFNGTLTIGSGGVTLAKTGVTNGAVAGNVLVGGGSRSAQLYLGSSDQIGDSSMMTFVGSSSGNNGGFYTHGHNETLGVLNVRGYGMIDFGTRGDSTVHFADSSGNPWKKYLSLQNYAAADHLYVSISSSGLTDQQLQRLQFVNPAGKSPGTYAGQILSTGEVVPGAIWTSPATNPQFPLVPYPMSVLPGTGTMSFGTSSSIVINDRSLASLGDLLSSEIQSLTGRQLAVRRGVPRAGDIVLSLDNTLTGEKYVYDVAAQAQVRGGNYQSVAQGTTTLLQSLSGTGSSSSLPKVNIVDQPAANTGYRALMIDTARSYHSIDTLEKEIEMCRLYKVPYLQLHLTDDQAFCFTTSVSGINGGNTTGTAGDSRIVPVYTQQQLRDLVSYADKRGVTIVPEIEIPGHAAQLVSRQPDLFKTGTYHHATANIANPDAIVALKIMVGELAGIFASSPYIHLGGDEADYSRLWYHNSTTDVFPAVRAQWDAKMDALSTQAGLPTGSIQNPEAVFRDYLNDMNAYVKGLGKKTIVWESYNMSESVIPLDKDITVMPFDQNATAENYIGNGFQLINSSWSPLYVVGFKGTGTGTGEGLADTVQNIYNWNKEQFGKYANPLSNGAKNYVSDSSADKILGGQLTLFENQESAEVTAARQRLAALSERLWSPDSEWTYSDFATRLTHTDAMLNSLLTTTMTASTVFPPIESVFIGSVDASWNTAANWGLGVPWNGDAITFSAGAGHKTSANNLNAASLTHVGLLTFAEGGFNITGNSLQLDAGISNAGNNTWAIASSLSGPQTFTSTSGTLTVSGSVNNGGYNLTVAGTGNTWISGAISGDGGLIKEGDSTLILSGTNIYKGSTTVDAGTLIATNSHTLPDGYSLTIGAGGTLIFDSSFHASTAQGLSYADSSMIQAVPEPSTFALLGTATLGLLGFLCRRCKPA